MTYDIAHLGSTNVNSTTINIYLLIWLHLLLWSREISFEPPYGAGKP